MERQQYQRYLQTRSLGLRMESQLALDDFIASFANLAEKVIWSKEFLASYDGQHLIPADLFAQIIFPALEAAADTDTAWYAQARQQCQQNFSANAV